LIISLIIYSSQVGAGFKELERLKDQPTVAQPSPYNIGDTLKWLRNGSQYEGKVIGVTNKETHWLGSDGCKEKFLNAGFSIASEWENCGTFGSGTAKIKHKGETWPLKKGKKWKINIQGNGWQLNRSCKVKDAVKIKINLGEYDTYKVQCNDSSNQLVWYINVKTGQTMYFTHTNSYYKTSTKLEVAN
jgi:hypothetical protein